MDKSAVSVRTDQVEVKLPGMIRQVKKNIWGYLFLLPAIIIFALFLWTPIFKGFVYSLYNIDFVKGNTFVGFDNYKTIFADEVLLKSVKNTLYYMFLCLVIGFWVPILFAVAISELRKFQGFVRIIAYLPNVIPVIVLYGLWRWMYDPVGPFNYVINHIFGLNSIAFMTDQKWSMASLVFMETWQQFGSGMLIYLAAVLSVPRDWYEAAEIDGAGIWARIRYITLPSIKNLILLMLLLQLIATSQGFQSQIAMLDGGPNYVTTTYALLINKYAFTRLDYGSASAMGVLMFVVLGILAVVQYRFSRKGEE
ncbi:MAG: sugar ABC transporter permease [Gorillibacterium sp.]|nr:sugar ABC transporter permease [Gorillibacterium sp.]